MILSLFRQSEAEEREPIPTNGSKDEFFFQKEPAKVVGAIDLLK